MVRVKICGITNLADAQTALKAGADAVGFIFAKSPRRVSEAEAKRIARSLGPRVTKVGVFVNGSVSGIARTMKHCGLDAIQLHGDETPKTVRALQDQGYPVIKAVPMGASVKRGKLDRYAADAYLLDTAMPGVYGGTGKSFDWTLLKKIKLNKPVLVSGGLKADNVRSLIKTYRPYGVDVSSGVEKAPGKKDPKRVKEFVHNAKKR